MANDAFLSTQYLLLVSLKTYSKRVAILIIIGLLCCMLLELDCIWIYKYHTAAISNSGCNGDCILGLRPANERRRYFAILDNPILHHLCPVCWSPPARQPGVTTPAQDCCIQILRDDLSQSQPLQMMTSSNGNIFRVTGHLCGKFTGHRWISHTKASDAELWCFLWSAPEWTVE